MSAAAWQRLRSAAEADEQVIGLVVTGGRGKGVWTDRSDWDGLLVTTDAVVDRWRARKGDDLDLTILDASGFVSYAEPFTPFAWRGYDFVRLTADIDRGGFQATLDRKGRLAPDPARRIAEEAIGGALNQLYRATKNARDDNGSATRLDLIEYVPYLLTSLFALEGRHRPYNKLLAWELGQEPLEAIGSEALSTGLAAVLEAVDVTAAWRLEAALEASCRRTGITETLIDWEDHLVAVRPR